MKTLTLSEANVVYQLLNTPLDFWSPDATQEKAIRGLVSRGLLTPRKKSRPLVTDALFDQFRVQVHRARAALKPLAHDDQAVLCTIRQEPDYRFVGCERRMANRLTREGMLTPASKPGRFLITYRGYIRYHWDCVLRRH